MNRAHLVTVDNGVATYGRPMPSDVATEILGIMMNHNPECGAWLSPIVETPYDPHAGDGFIEELNRFLVGPEDK